MKILIVEDNKDIVANLYDYFEPLGYSLDSAYSGPGGLSLAATGNYDVIILDVMLPGIDGVQVCFKLRQELKIKTPVLMLTARDSIEDKVLGLEQGADDYVIKPFSLIELDARLKALVRRASDSHIEDTLTLGSLVFNQKTLALSREGVPLVIKPIGYKILSLLMKESPAIVTRTQLEQAAWGNNPPDSDALRTHIHTLRQVLDKSFEKSMLKTIQGIGYRMVNPDE
uniref:response regulator transcription factor n=1 Tax=Marinobacterium profundum TaxID=1714300 RepID=UPI00082BB52E|nr:response regulator transcription factor [Marinobacterium profundum]